MTSICELSAEILIRFIGETTILQCEYEPNLLAEDIFCQGLCFSCFITVLVFSEIFKVTAVIEYQKTTFFRVFAVYTVNTGKLFAKSCASAYHLPEFSF